MITITTIPQSVLIILIAVVGAIVEVVLSSCFVGFDSPM